MSLYLLVHFENHAFIGLVGVVGFCGRYWFQGFIGLLGDNSFFDSLEEMPLFLFVPFFGYRSSSFKIILKWCNLFFLFKQAAIAVKINSSIHGNPV